MAADHDRDHEGHQQDDDLGHGAEVELGVFLVLQADDQLGEAGEIVLVLQVGLEIAAAEHLVLLQLVEDHGPCGQADDQKGEAVGPAGGLKGLGVGQNERHVVDHDQQGVGQTVRRVLPLEQARERRLGRQGRHIGGAQGVLADAAHDNPVVAVEAEEQGAPRQVLDVGGLLAEDDFRQADVEREVLGRQAGRDVVEAGVRPGQGAFEHGPGDPAVGLAMDVVGLSEDVVDREDDQQHQEQEQERQRHPHAPPVFALAGRSVRGVTRGRAGPGRRSDHRGLLTHVDGVQTRSMRSDISRIY